jgi:hypothetical protein
MKPTRNRPNSNTSHKPSHEAQIVSLIRKVLVLAGDRDPTLSTLLRRAILRTQLLKHRHLLN